MSLGRRPITPPEILDLIEEREITGWNGSVWREVFEGSDPLQPNIRGGRWNPVGVDALYTAASAAGAKAEIDHLSSRQSIPIARPRVTYELRVELSRVADLRAKADLNVVGITPEVLSGDAMTACQDIGAGAAWLGFGGLLVPSARFEGWNLVIFVNAAAPDDVWQVVLP